MHNLLKFYFSFYLIILVCYSVKAQDNSIVKDSVLLEKLTLGMERFYNNPYDYKLRFKKADIVLKRLIKANPQSVYLKNKKVDLTNYYTFFLRRSLNDKAYLKKMYKNIDLRRELDDTCGLSISFRKLAVFWRTKKQFTDAYSFIEKARKQSLMCNDSLELLLNDITFAKIKKINKERYNFDSIYVSLVKRAENIKSSRGLASANYNYASYLFTTPKIELANKYLRKAEQYAKADNDIIRLKSIYSRKGNYYRKKNDFKRALVFFNKALVLNEKIKDSLSLSKNYLGVSNSYSGLKKHELALKNYIKYKRIQTRLNNTKYSKKTLELKYKRQKSLDSVTIVQKELIFKNQKEQKEQRKFWIVVCSLLSLLCLVTIGYFKYRLRNKETENKNTKLKQEVTLKTNEVTDLLVETVEHIQTKKVLSKNLKRLSAEEDGVSLKGILTDLKVENLADSKRLLIKENIEIIQSDFRHKLKEIHPNLTKTDVEVATFIRLGLSRKQIASLRNTTIHAAKSSRYRLNKKLNLDESQSTETYLKSI